MSTELRRTDNEPATNAGMALLLVYPDINGRRDLRDRILAIEREAAERASGWLDRMALAAAIQVVGLPMQYVHRIIDAYDRATPQPGEDR